MYFSDLFHVFFQTLNSVRTILHDYEILLCLSRSRSCVSQQHLLRCRQAVYQSTSLLPTEQWRKPEHHQVYNRCLAFVEESTSREEQQAGLLTNRSSSKLTGC